MARDLDPDISLPTSQSTQLLNRRRLNPGHLIRSLIIVSATPPDAHIPSCHHTWQARYFLGVCLFCDYACEGPVRILLMYFSSLCDSSKTSFMEPQIIFRVRLAPPLAPCATNAAPANPEMIFVSPADTRFGGLFHKATNRFLAELPRLRLRLVFAAPI